ncbi:MAG: phenylphosphate carboxylase subunit beta [Deltaproteobacteria bacterium HGW-Deltaproteobacteria-15]|jgi:4-hydroxy-3-polyprenylbenzoate decarboxylase|nr:MAG: phenylphosphate carboxylase subunit beta [Deltaproteobacteria bacterium HGW-Deltaproteobacteria-15]
MINDLRDFINESEKKGELKRIRAEVDWDLELSHVCKLNEARGGGQALLFENVKGSKGVSVLGSALTTEKRLAISLGVPDNYRLCQQAREWVKLTSKENIPPVIVSEGPVMENVLEGDRVDLFSLPVPRFAPLDGGRYIGTAVSIVTQDPDAGWTNVGTYRMQLTDRNHSAIQIHHGKHADLMLDRYRELGKPMPAAAIIGTAPILFIMSSTTAPWGVCEYDLAGAIRGAPIEVLKSDLTGLLIPAAAEIVLEGEINPDRSTYGREGPFGEYTGYYSAKAGKEYLEPVFHVKRILHRNNPIFWVTTTGQPITDIHMFGALQISASIWSDLRDMRIPGIQSVYSLPEGCGRLTVVVSVKQRYPGHSTQVGHAIAGSTSGHYRLKNIIIVDDDIPADDLQKVWWAISTRLEAKRSVHVLHGTRGGPLDPAVHIEDRDVGSKLILDATIPFHWDRKPLLTRMDDAMLERVRKRWAEYGFDDNP